MYETIYLEKNPNFFHIQTTQIFKLNKMIDEPDFIHPRENEIFTLIGKPVLIENSTNEIIRKIDLQKLL